jgi:uncharacterized protein (TIGR00725 family)
MLLAVSWPAGIRRSRLLRSKNEDLMARIIIGVMGGAQVSDEVNAAAFHLGKLIAEKGWILLNGGRSAGVMRSSAQGAKSAGGLTVGILPGWTKREANEFIDIPILTNMGSARNVLNVMSCDVVVAFPGLAGTISEIALALKNNKHVILIDFHIENIFKEYVQDGLLIKVNSAEKCITEIEKILKTAGS